MAVQPPVDFVIVTALEEERAAVLRHLPNPQQLPPANDDIRVYYASELPATFSGGQTCTYSVIVLSPLKMGRVDAVSATNDAIRRWQPKNVLLVGIVGGFSARGVQLGDLLISDQIVDVELQKLTPDGPEVRYDVHQADPRLLVFVQSVVAVMRQPIAKIRRPGKGEPALRIGPIATGDKVDAFGEIERRHRQAWPKLLGVEMEAGGVASACFQAPSKPGFFMIRGVSDLADATKNSAHVKKWRPYACEVAATFAISLLRRGPIPKDSPGTLAGPP